MLGVLFVWSSVFLCLNITCGFWCLFDFLISWFLHLTRTFWLRICYPRLIAELVWFECWTRLQLIMSPGEITKLICLTAMSCAEWMSTRGWLGCNKSDMHLFSHRMLVKAWILVRCWKLCFWNTPTGRTCGSFPKILMHLFQDPKHAELQKDLMARRQEHYNVQTPSPKHVSTCCVVRPWYMYVVGEGFCCQNMHGWKRAISHPLLFHFCLVLWKHEKFLFNTLCNPL